MMNPIFPRFIRDRWDRKALGGITVGDLGLALSIGAVVAASVAWGSAPAALGAIAEVADDQVEAAGAAALEAALGGAVVVPGYCAPENVRPLPQVTPKRGTIARASDPTEVVFIWRTE